MAETGPLSIYIMKNKLFVDDIRNAPDDSWDVVKSYDEFVEYISTNGVPGMISFDHDLGEGKDGYDCAKWLMYNDYPIHEFVVHSMNPIGKKNIEEFLKNWKNFKGNGVINGK